MVSYFISVSDRSAFKLNEFLFIKKSTKWLVGLFLVLALYARADVVREDTQGIDNRPASYSDNFVEAYNSPNLSHSEVLYSKSHIEALIRSKARIWGLDEDLLVRIARCESGLKNVPNYLYDGENGTYSAFGPFQILKSTAARYSTLDRRTVENNIDIAIQIFQNEGLRPWKLSLGCFSKH